MCLQGIYAENARQTARAPVNRIRYPCKLKALSFQDSADRKQTRARYRALVKAVTKAIEEADPKGLLQLGAPNDEYSPEAGTIVPRVSRASSVDEVRQILHEEFSRWFGADEAGLEEAYMVAATRIWDAVLAYRGRR